MREFLHSFEKLELDKIRSQIQRHALSDLGRERIRQLVPFSDIDQLHREMRATTEMKELLISDESLPFDHVYDLRASLQRSTIEDFVLPAADLLAISKVIATSRNIHSYFNRRAERYQVLAERTKHLYHEKVLQYNIDQAIDDDASVRDTASKELSSLRRRIGDARHSLRRGLETILRRIADKGWAQEEIITTREGRMVIPVKVEHKNLLPGFIHSASASGATVFIEPTETLELNNGIQTLLLNEQREILRILKGLTEEVREVSHLLLEANATLGYLDFVLSKARYSIEIQGSEPKMSSYSAIRLIHAFHPLLLTHHNRSDIVPLTLDLGQSYNTLVITGPNAGGKSVAMKTVGILCLMAQSGCHIPASGESEIPVFENIFVDMGDEQSIENDLSSFSSHLENLKVILETATQNSLILIDEIGSGTDPAEGGSLAAAVLEHLASLGCLTIVTTHHGVLKTFAFDNPRIENGAMEFDQSSLRPTYTFKPGIPGSSYAFEMARRMGLPSEIIDRAISLGGSKSGALEKLIVELEHQSQDMRSRLGQIEAEREEARLTQEKYHAKIKDYEKEVKVLKVKAIADARVIINDANAVIEKTIREIKESSASAEKVKQLRNTLKDISRELIPFSPQGVSDSLVYEFSPGDNVRIRETDTVGQIASKVDDNHYLIIAGQMKLRVAQSNLEKCLTKKQNLPTDNVLLYSPDPKNEIDVRGMYGDQALTVIDKFLDDAIHLGLHRVDIIHGKGTGVLRKRVTEYLHHNTRVKSFRLGDWNEGGAGVTVIELA